MKNQQQILATEPIGKLLLKYSVPAIIGMIVNALYNVVDRMFIGNIPKVGVLAITGVGVTMPIMTIMLAFGMLIALGAIANISIKLGQGKKEDAELIIGNAITLSILISLLISFIGILFGDIILKSFGASESTLYYAKSYIYIILGGSVFCLLSFSLNNTIRGDGNPKLAAIMMIVGCLVNVVLDAVLIFVFNMGIQGAAIATVTSQAVTTIWGFIYYLKGKSNLKLKKENLKLNKDIVKTIFAIGLAPFAMQIAASLVQIISNNALKAYGGDVAIGAMATIASISMIFLMPVFGINQGAQPIIGFNYGARQYDRANKTFKVSASVACLIMTLGWLIIQLKPEIIVGIFNKDSKLMDITINGTKLYLFMLPIIGISITGSNYMQSVGKAKSAMILGLLRQVILLIPMIIILPKFLGLDGIWYAQAISDLLSTIITITVLVKELKKYKDFKNDIQSKNELQG